MVSLSQLNRRSKTDIQLNYVDENNSFNLDEWFKSSQLKMLT